MEELRILKKKIELPEFKNDKTNIAIHIRRGDVEKDSYYSKRYTDNEVYIKIIEKLQKKYDNCNICIFSEGTDGFDEFRKMNNVKLLNDLDILETFEYFCNADVLIIAKSSLSYLAGLYNKNPEIYIEKSFWHSKLSRWNYIEDLISDSVESYTNINDYLWMIFIFIILFIYYILFNIQKVTKNIKIIFRRLLFYKNI